MHDDSFLTRRSFIAASGAVGLAAVAHASNPKTVGPALTDAVSNIDYLTPHDRFLTVERGNPLPSELSEEKRKEVGLDRATWKLEVVADEASGARVGKPLSIAGGNAVDWAMLMSHAAKHSTSCLKAMTCSNIDGPLGVGLWEGVPLRELVWLVQPKERIRRLYYYGYHNDDPKQRFQSSLSIGRVLEDPPGDPPVLVCYKLNGEWLTPKRGGPVRMLVPDAYGFKSVKWLQRIVLTNDFQANDTYAKDGNDIDAPVKTVARFARIPSNAKAGAEVPVVGLALVGISGLKKVQYLVRSAEEKPSSDDPWLLKGEWRDAEIIGPPTKWGGGLKDGKLPSIPFGFDAKSGAP